MATAADHLEQAERLLAEAEQMGQDGPWRESDPRVAAATAHALVAIAIEVGVPHAVAAPVKAAGG